MNTSFNKVELRRKFDDKLDQMIECFYKTVPGAKYQKESKEIDTDYYKRHCIETILRIRHKRMIDALVIHYFTKTNPRAAKMWAEYIEDEMLHGHMFANDLEKQFGLSMDNVLKFEPLLSTKLLNGYFYFTLEHEGPMAAIASAYFLEYTTRKTQPDWLDNLERVFGTENIRGARGHVNHDIKADHSEFVWNVLMETINTENDIKILEKHFENIYGLFAAYFTDVYQETIGKNEIGSIQNIACSSISYSRGINLTEESKNVRSFKPVA